MEILSNILEEVNCNFFNYSTQKRCRNKKFQNTTVCKKHRNIIFNNATKVINEFSPNKNSSYLLNFKQIFLIIEIQRKFKKRYKLLNKKAYIIQQIIKKKLLIICSICYTSSKNKTINLICGHIFCKECIDKWFKKTYKCPICRTDELGLIKINICFKKDKLFLGLKNSQFNIDNFYKTITNINTDYVIEKKRLHYAIIKKLEDIATKFFKTILLYDNKNIIFKMINYIIKNNCGNMYDLIYIHVNNYIKVNSNIISLKEDINIKNYKNLIELFNNLIEKSKDDLKKKFIEELKSFDNHISQIYIQNSFNFFTRIEISLISKYLMQMIPFIYNEFNTFQFPFIFEYKIDGTFEDMIKSLYYDIVCKYFDLYIYINELESLNPDINISNKYNLIVTYDPEHKKIYISNKIIDIIIDIIYNTKTKKNLDSKCNEISQYLNKYLIEDNYKKRKQKKYQILVESLDIYYEILQKNSFNIRNKIKPNFISSIFFTSIIEHTQPIYQTIPFIY
jgi:hypothetical protein